MRQISCGLDFGTSNSTLGIVDAHGTPQLLQLEAEEPTIPSVLFFNFENDQVYFGRTAIEEYISGADGRMLRALKSVLGSSLMNDQTRIKAERMPFTKILGIFLDELKQRAQNEVNGDLEQVVVGRPVHFVDDDEAADKRAEGQLRTAVEAQGFKHIEFQFEPIAAALDYEHRISDEKLALVVDIGGGTSDFTAVRLSPERAQNIDRKSDILGTAGVHVGGTDFDRLLSMSSVMPLMGLGSLTKTGNRSLPVGPYYDLATWHRINRLYTRQTMVDLRSTRQEAQQVALVEKLIAIVAGRYGHLLASSVEQAKIDLTELSHLNWHFVVDEVSLSLKMTKEGLNGAIQDAVNRIPQTIQHMLSTSGIKPSDIDTLIMTGGSTQIPTVRQSFNALFPDAEFVKMDAFGSVGLGLALEASRRF